MIHILKGILDSLTKSLDIFYVIKGNKPVARILYNENPALLDFLTLNNLYYEASDFKILKTIDTTRNFSDKGYIVNKDDKRTGIHFLYISKSKGLAKKAKALEAKGNHQGFGKILGYPSCCCKFFEKYSETASKGNNDFLKFTFASSEGIKFPWQNNFCLRVFDVSLISHFPCSFNCEKTKTLAKSNFDIINLYEQDLARYFQNALTGAVIYSDGVGVYNLKKYTLLESSIIYSPKDIITTNNNEFYSLLASSNRLSFLSKNNILVGSTKIDDPHTFLGVFQ